MPETGKEEIKKSLTLEAQEKFEDVASQRVLGATAHIRLISEMLLDIADHAPESGETGAETAEQAEKLAEFFINTRGKASQAISNAIKLMMTQVYACDRKDGPEVARAIRCGVEEYMQLSQENLDTIYKYVWSIIRSMKTIMLFDYSSTVNSISRISAEHGHFLECYVPQSITLDGGRPYVKSFRDAGHTVHVIPDAAMYYFIKKCDGAFIGAETFYHDGRAFNTTGSEMLAYLCKSFGVPFYVLTPLIKLDIRAMFGYEKPPVMIQIPDRTGVTFSEEEKMGVDFQTPELVEIPAEYIHAYVTEEGILPPWGMCAVSREYYKKLEK